MALVKINESHKKIRSCESGERTGREEEVTGTEGREVEVVEGKNSQMNSIHMEL